MLGPLLFLIYMNDIVHKSLLPVCRQYSIIVNKSKSIDNARTDKMV